MLELAACAACYLSRRACVRCDSMTIAFYCFWARLLVTMLMP